MIEKIVDSLDRIPEKVLLVINLLMAAFVLLAHGGYAALTLSEGGEIPLTIMISVPLSILVILSCIIGFITNKYRLIILSVQSPILLLGSIYILHYALSILIKGLPEGNFGWGLGLLTFFCFYPVYLVRRSILGSFIKKSAVVKYIHVFILVVVLSIDIAVFVKTATHFANYHRKLFEKHQEEDIGVKF